MAESINRVSSAARGTPVVAEGNGVERGSVSAAPTSDPAPADYRKRLLAYEAGKQAKAAGATAAEALCWLAGYDGEPMPEFGEEW